MKNLKVRYLNENEYALWDEFVDSSPQGNIFNKSYWLQAVSSDLKIMVCEENGSIAGGIALPSIYGGFYRNPKLTPQMGVLLPKIDSKEKYSTRLAREIEITSAIIDNLPKFKQFSYSFSTNFTNLLPFVWNDFKTGIAYTYVIEDLSDPDSIYNDFQYDIKYSIKKALKSNIKVSSDCSIKDFYEVNQKTFKRQNMEMPYTFELIEVLDRKLEEKGNRKMLFGINEEGKIIAGVYILYDSKFAYYLMGGADPEYRNTGVQAMLLWEGIKFASTVSKSFDFEGSSVKSIESYFRGFGGRQKVIYNIYKGSPLTDMLYVIARKNKNIIRKIIKV